MADLTDLSSTLPVKIIGSSPIGVEQTPVGSTINGELLVRDEDLNAELAAQDPFSTTTNNYTVAASVTSVLLINSNVNRRQLVITNTSNKRLWICTFTPATSATAYFLDKDESWTFPGVTDSFYGIWDTGASGTGDAHIAEHIL